MLTLRVKRCLVMGVTPRASLGQRGAVAETRCRELSLPRGLVSYHSATAFFPHKEMRRTNFSHPRLPSILVWFSEASSHTRAARAAAVPPAPALLAALLAPAAPPGTLPACQRRGFGKEAASNHSCGWDVVSILSPSFLLLPRLYQTSTRIRAAQLLLQGVQRR